MFSQNRILLYEESFEDFSNPDRGFYSPISGIASNFNSLSVEQLQSLKNNAFIPWQASYMVKTSLVLRHYVLDSYVNIDTIPQSFLYKVQDDFDAARQAGIRLILRFSYTIVPPEGDCGSWICPPYGDAPKSRVLSHIAQLKPLLQFNEDIISTVQHGFIGVWGENYYTDYFGDASLVGQGKLSDQNWQDRIDVLAALLDAVPKSRMVQIRYPQLKQKYIYGIGAPTTTQPMTKTQAYTGSDIARIGFHNDCFLSAPDDQGTYWNYGSSTEPILNETEILKPYASKDGKYTAIGGETCSDSVFDPLNNCDDSGGIALEEMNKLHYSYLNSAYNNDVNNDWETEGCMDEIKRRLGYRFVLRKGVFSEIAVPGDGLNVSFDIENVGFAAPFNENNLELILRSVNSGLEYKFGLQGENSDPRYWFSSQIVTLEDSIILPSDIPEGDYSLFLCIKDPTLDETLVNFADYSIRLANIGTWESSSGYNDLKHVVTIAKTTNLTNSEPNPGLLIISPNPISNFVNIQYSISEASKVTITLCNINGNKIVKLLEKNHTPGKHHFQFNLQELPSGIYLMAIKTGNFCRTTKFVKL